MMFTVSWRNNLVLGIGKKNIPRETYPGKGNSSQNLCFVCDSDASKLVTF